MKTLNDFQQIVWFINESEIKSATLEMFLGDFWKDESGYMFIKNSTIIKAIVSSNNKLKSFCFNDEELIPEEGESVKWAIRNGRGANYQFFDSEQEAYLAVLNKKYVLLEEGKSTLNKIFQSEQEAIDFKNPNK